VDDRRRAQGRQPSVVDRQGNRVPLKTDESKATLPLPAATAVMMLEHRAHSACTGPRSFVFASRSGRALSQRNVLRALYQAQERARDADGRPTFPTLFEHDRRGALLTDDDGAFVVRRIPRDLPPLPDFHALRHTAAMDCEDAEEAVICCDTATPMSHERSTGLTSKTGGVSSCVPVWKRAWKQRAAAKGRSRRRTEDGSNRFAGHSQWVAGAG
jgi:hypothetical protein